MYNKDAEEEEISKGATKKGMKTSKLMACFKSIERDQRNVSHSYSLAHY
jgi:hypothetical protein